MTPSRACLCLILSACTPGTDPTPPPPATITVATFNVARFFDGRCDSGTCGDGAFEEAPTSATLLARASEVAEGIEALDADVVLLQEIETDLALNALKLAFDPRPVTSVLGEIGGRATLDTAMISRHPAAEIIEHRDTLTRPDGTETQFSRVLLEARFDIEGTRVIAFCAHFRSKRDDDPGRRYAEAVATGQKVRSAYTQNPDALIVAGGDLNDTPGSDPLNALETTGNLHRVAASLAPNDATYTLFGTPVALDHLYVPSEQAAAFISAKIHTTDGARGYAGSDHRALSAELQPNQP